MTHNSCYHCGDEIIGKSIEYDDKEFCCNGCKGVYELLSTSGLDSFYSLDTQPGVKPAQEDNYKYAFLEIDSIRRKFIDFEDDKHVHITLFLPQVHCSSCIYLLENIHKLEPRVTSCQVNFTKRQASIIFSKDLQLVELAAFLDSIGYAPNFGSREEQKKKRNKTYLYKLGVSGFAFGSIMLWSFPEYLGVEKDNPEFRNFTSYLSFAVSIPVLLYSASEYLISAYKALKHKSINLDVPISIGILALYAQSAYNIIVGLGPGYMDSFAGFVFFLLIGKWFQNKTYDSLSFERDYTAYFPVAVTRIKQGSEQIVEIDEIEIEDNLIIRNLEIIPCDSILESAEIKVDYSFVTGESIPVTKKKGDFIYAGGKLLGQKSQFRVQKESSRSHLTQLWNEAGKKEENESKSDKFSIFFLVSVLVIALITGIVWTFISPSRITEIVVSVLIVACPCALALSAPFTYGNIMRVLGRKGLYLKNVNVIEKINSITDIVFDKTGTLTTGSNNKVEFIGEALSQTQINQIVLVANSSTHPLSRAIVDHLKSKMTDHTLELIDFHENSGKGIQGIINDQFIQMGSASFVHSEAPKRESETSTHIAIDGIYIGRFVFDSEFRPRILEVLENLNSSFRVHVLSGDKDKDIVAIQTAAPSVSELHFNQTPKDKLNYIQSLQQSEKNVMMVGDGLNDAGALEAAKVGIAVSEDIFRFTPSSDAIIEASKLYRLNQFISTAQHSKVVLTICYVFSIVYNIVGLSFAITGNLTPLIAAILMPLSSISVVLLSTLSVNLKD